MPDRSPLILSRRAFLSGVATMAIAPSLPAIASPAAPPVAAAAETLPMFVCGTEGDFNWRAYAARTADEARSMWLDEEVGDDEEEREGYALLAERVPKWDGLSEAEIKPADWLDADLGHCCSRCGWETHRDEGARAIGDEAVCAECLTFADKVLSDEDDVLDELADMIADQGEDDARTFLDERGDWDVIPEGLWLRAVSLAEETA